MTMFLCSQYGQQYDVYILLKGCHKNAVRDVFSLSDKVKKVSSMWILLAKNIKLCCCVSKLQRTKCVFCVYLNFFNKYLVLFSIQYICSLVVLHLCVIN